MSDHLPLDKHIKEQLGQYSPDVPPHIWDQIVAQREQQRPKGFWFRMMAGRKWLLVATLFLGLGGTAYWMTQGSDSPTLAEKGNKEQNASQPNTNNAAPMANQQPQLQNNTTNNSNATSNNNNTIQPNTADVNTNVGTPTGATPTMLGQNSPAAPTATANPMPTASNAGRGLSPLYDNNSRTTNTYQPSRATSGTRSRISQQVGVGADGEDADISAIDDGNTHRIRPTKTGADVVGYALEPMTDAASFLAADRQASGELQKRMLYNLLLPDCPNIEDDAAANKKYIEVYAGPDFGLRSFSSFSSDSSSNNYLQRRKESAKFASAFSVGLRYTKVFNNGMSLRSGINYSQINEKFLYINEKDIRYILVITPRQIFVGGNTVTVYDTLRYTETGKRIKTTYNRYRSIDIPLQLGYEFGNGRLHTNISAGAIINLYSWQKGDMLDTAYQPVSITTGKGSSVYGFKTNIGVGFLGSVSVYYKLRPRLHVLAEPYFRYNLQPMTRDNQNVTQKYSTLGLRLGLRWDFK